MRPVYVVYKYDADERHLYRVPEGAVVLVATQRLGQKLPTVWVRHEVNAEPTRTLYPLGTGHPMDETAIVVGSAVCGNYVWHIVEAD